MTFRQHPTPPKPDQGAIEFFAESPTATAVTLYKLMAEPRADPPVALFDLHNHDSIDGCETLEDLQDEVGAIVFPDLASYKRSSGWRFSDVLEALGVDAAELHDAELAAEGEDPEGWPSRSVWVDDAVSKPYDFSSMPPTTDLWPDHVDTAAMQRRAMEVVADFRGHAEIEGGHLEITEEMCSVVRARVHDALDRFWPDLASVTVTARNRELNCLIEPRPLDRAKPPPGTFRCCVPTCPGLGWRASERPHPCPLPDPAAALAEVWEISDRERHAVAWAAHMRAHDPRGYTFEETPQGWELRLAGSVPGFLDMVSMASPTAADIAESMQLEVERRGITGVVFEPRKPDRAAARAAAWAHCLENEAGIVVDLLGLVSVWPERHNSTIWPDHPSDEEMLERRRWVQGWTLLERGLATRWAVATHVAASDNDDVEIPPRPPCLDRDRPA